MDFISFFLTIINTTNNLFLLFQDSFIIRQVGKRFHQHHIVVTLILNSKYFEELQNKYWIPHFCKHTEFSTRLLFCITVHSNPYTSTYKYSSWLIMRQVKPHLISCLRLLKWPNWRGRRFRIWNMVWGFVGQWTSKPVRKLWKCWRNKKAMETTPCVLHGHKVIWQSKNSCNKIFLYWCFTWLFRLD